MSNYSTQGFDLNSTGRRIVVDPVTRIEGHMRVEVNLDANNIIRNAVSTGTMWRGLEVILKGRDPRDAWAFVERICGVCTSCHALASVRAVEDALGIRIPPNAHLIREMMAKTLQIHDHAVHFYHLHALDWVDVVSALKADPKRTSELQQQVSPAHPLSSPGYFRDVQNRLKKFFESGQLGPFMNGYWGNPAYQLPPEANLMAVTHYLEALDLQKEWVKIHTIFGGKNPHPNYLVGGVPCAINIDGDLAAGAPLNMERLNFVRARIDEALTFCKNVYVPDVLAIGTIYKQKGWLHGGGLAATNVMDYGNYPKVNYDESTNQLPGGAILNGNWNEIHPVDPRDPEQVQEFVTHSWYNYPDNDKGLHPWDGITEANYELGAKTKGTRTAIEEVDESAKYSWVKSPRWRGHAMEVGPLARYILGYAHAVQGNPRAQRIKEQLDGAMQAVNHDLPKTLGIVETDYSAKILLPSTIGRTLTRALEAEYCAELMVDDWNELMTNIRNGDRSTANVEKWDPATWPKEAKGVGIVAAPRGALGHWIRIKDGRIENYQCVVPSTWNGSPRDAKGQIGAFEAALMNTPVAIPDQPVEILRTLHSFDPCMACATHVMSEDGAELSTVKVS
ncbi:nickel-dependent hydrogenase large subunit [Pseudomonas sp. CCI3.2]|uniref:nickel-dependent hydrogenase large subunit n=1 Tax=unclassified Pseudomonas TaxID=196821 RepID=UPI002AC9D037|nr:MULTISPECIES: nickel-dependent hydrogenase large subunit [unclassified Pseudomonas]MEB0078570.1 nickel-dependent hydrogenase large subunit [Pseudomonas sp. MH10out]MEB0092130.1 nickel-dependent hydrogenase large subunit [Pseudomonas sp. CCI4.2]MEB0100385.1 nickel-dependent hydrogenase large subunit [Pseudomonas sp. CCI3.2]MEB0129591.1 nickel-dependent hydrogenase large subunit [Pseudomonas sp. CCI2.4]MEB0159105.1 nickel-dependent hydrogenase large subunit [Pseudomonas sp. AH2 (2023)]